MSHACKQLIIFEGPDGGGKTTLAKNVAAEIGARYVHFPALKSVSQGLGRMYVEAMIPALMGYQPVVFDRSWYSEVPYGLVYRGGDDRLGWESRRMLDRLAMRCDARIVLCRPSNESLIKSFHARRENEMLDNDSQLINVAEIYDDLYYGLPLINFNYDQDNLSVVNTLTKRICGTHNVGLMTAGNACGSILIVGDSFAERKDQDSFYQWPFASFSGSGCSRWLTRQIGISGAHELDLCWVNSDEIDSRPVDQNLRSWLINKDACYALGSRADEILSKLGVPHDSFEHPQHFRRFRSGVNVEYGLTKSLELGFSVRKDFDKKKLDRFPGGI